MNWLMPETFFWYVYPRLVHQPGGVKMVVSGTVIVPMVVLLELLDIARVRYRIQIAWTSILVFNLR